MRVSRVRAVRGEVYRHIIQSYNLEKKGGLVTYPFLIRGHIVITQRAVNIDNPVGRTLGQNGMNPAFRILDILLHKGDT